MGRVTPIDVDDMEMWQIAVLLGHSDELGDPKSKSDGGAASADARAERALERNRARMAAMRGECPMPEAQPVDPATFNQLAGALRGGT